ncbi:beta-galactosidase [Kiritimatiellaeota bacterium B1221]|nr:beta-galactosidase [Kiritimatiellaeota bacterium B1221]
MKNSHTIFSDFPYFAHGGDYNPDQWMHRYPEVLEEDLRLMNLANCNTFSLGIFSWMDYEPREDEFHFDWMRKILDNLHGQGSQVVLATPSGSKPAWLSKAYPEVCRVNEQGLRAHHHRRHNHCMTSPVYREKVAILNQKLAKEFGDHPAVKMWHLSNEYGGECHCDLCHRAFQDWLKNRYETLDELNHAWWSYFWSHRIGDWSEIDPRDESVDGMRLDWRRFVSHQTLDFMKAEIAALRAGTATQPVTTNMMGFYQGLDYWRFAEVVDVISDDAYPQWKNTAQDLNTAALLGCVHDMHRSMKQGKPWMLIESCPDAPQWQGTARLKRPGVYRNEMLQAVAHGADAIMYFQWRKGRGGSEKFHGAVVDHEGSENTRVFKQVSELGSTLQKLAPIVGTSTKSEVAVIMDWDSRWALECSQGPLIIKGENQYLTPILKSHRGFWENGVSTDVLESLGDFSGYRMVIAPQLYLLKPGVAERLRRFVEDGGTLVLTYLSGVVGESNLCLREGFPGGGLRKLCGVWAEEIDYLYEGETQEIDFLPGNTLELKGRWQTGRTCERVHAEGAEILATFTHDFYAGSPALTCNAVGKGSVYYLAASMDTAFWKAFSQSLISNAKLSRILETELPEGVHIRERGDENKTYIFIQNFNNHSVEIDLGNLTGRCMETGLSVQGRLKLKGWHSRVLCKKRHSLPEE